MLGRIVIWNRMKIVFVTAMGMWVTEISLFIYGKDLLRITGGYFVNLVILQLLPG